MFQLKCSILKKRSMVTYFSFSYYVNEMHLSLLYKDQENFLQSNTLDQDTWPDLV